MSESGMTKNQELNLWCKKSGNAQKLANAMGVSKQYISELRKLKAGISDQKWAVIKGAMEVVG